MVEPLIPIQKMRVRFPLRAPNAMCSRVNAPYGKFVKSSTTDLQKMPNTKLQTLNTIYN